MTGRDTLDRLRRLDSCAVSDALDQLGLIGVVDQFHPLSARQRIAGRAVTVELGPPSKDVPARHLCSAAVEASGPSDVIVVAHQGRLDCAGWGGNLSRGARHREVQGTIVDGAIRDVDESEQLGYPVYALAATPRTARGRAQEHAWATAVRIGDVLVNPGDYVLADGTGVVFVAAARIDDVLEAAEAIAAKESLMAAAIEQEEALSTVMDANYETMLQEDRQCRR
jgi:4-hydroxy-4-methyl-2-oxoglutarate aldolase